MGEHTARFGFWPRDILLEWKPTALIIIAPFLLTYLITTWNSLALPRKALSSKRPPTVPYVLPYLGHLISFGLRGGDFLLENAAKFGRSNLYKLVLPGLNQYMASQPDNTGRVFRAQGMVMTESQVVAMERSFGMSSQAVALYRADDSDYGPNPRPGSKVQPGDRIMYEIHRLLNRDLSGESLTGITSRFQQFLSEELSNIPSIGPDWVDIPDLSAFMQLHVMKAAVKSIFGPYLLSLNPTLIDDFWAWVPDIGPLYMGLPKWLIPGAYRRRDKMIKHFIRWQKHANEHYDCNNTSQDNEDWEPYFGSKLSRRRRDLFGRWAAMDARAKAADDLSFLWASNANSVFGALWYLLELVNDPSLMARIHKEFLPAVIPPLAPCKVPTFDIDTLCSGPLCQSVYAEVLRLRVGVVLSRRAYQDIKFAGWDIKKGERVSVASSTEAMDETVWNTGTETDPHPLDSFWADRFLVYPKDPRSGPAKQHQHLKSTVSAKRSDNMTDLNVNEESPWFSMQGVSKSWIPFSGGPRHCPGRHFAKQEMISVAAIMTAAFEIELQTKPGWKPRSDNGYFGFGTMPPMGKIPVRIRRRT